MKKILLIAVLGTFLGVVSVSATEMNTVHKNVRTEQKVQKSGTQKKAHLKSHKKGMHRNVKSSINR